MPGPWLPILFAALLAAGCGSSSGSNTASSAGTTATTATTSTTATTPTVDGADLRRLLRAPDASGTPPRPAAGSRDAFLRAVFDDAERLWDNEFRGAGLTYRSRNASGG